MADIRDSKARVWEPSALVRGIKDRDSSDDNGLASGVSTSDVNEGSIDMTTLVVKAKGEAVFAGRGDGPIVTSDTSSGKMQVFCTRIRRTSSLQPLLVVSTRLSALMLVDESWPGG